MSKLKNKFRLRNMDVTRVDLVDRGANQNAHIVLAKRDSKDKGDTGEKGSVRVKGELAQRIREVMAEKEKGEEGDNKMPEDKPKGGGRTPISRPRGEEQRIPRLKPTDFEVVAANGNMMEWAIPEDSLPEGVEEAMMTMVQSGEDVMFQWLLDPLAGPPVEGQAKTAAEAFVAMRAAIMNQGAADPMQALGGLPGEPAQPEQMPQQQQKPQQQKPKEKQKSQGVAKRARIRKQYAEVLASRRNPKETLGDVLDIITKGLVEVNVFAETATGEDLGDILPEDSLEELSSKLSTDRVPSNPKEKTDG